MVKFILVFWTYVGSMTVLQTFAATVARVERFQSSQLAPSLISCNGTCLLIFFLKSEMEFFVYLEDDAELTWVLEWRFIAEVALIDDFNLGL